MKKAEALQKALQLAELKLAIMSKPKEFFNRDIHELYTVPAYLPPEIADFIDSLASAGNSESSKEMSALMITDLIVKGIAYNLNKFVDSVPEGVKSSMSPTDYIMSQLNILKEASRDS